MTTSESRRPALPDRAIHRLLNLYAKTQEHHRTKKAAEIAAARLEEACEIAALVTGHNNGNVVWLAIVAVVCEVGPQLNGQAYGTRARDERLAALIAAVRAELARRGGYV